MLCINVELSQLVSKSVHALPVLIDLERILTRRLFNFENLIGQNKSNERKHLTMLFLILGKQTHLLEVIEDGIDIDGEILHGHASTHVVAGLQARLHRHE